MAALRQFYRGTRQHARVFGALAQVIPRAALPLLRKKLSKLQNVSVLTCWNLLGQKMQLLVGEKNSEKLECVWKGQP